MKYNVFYCSWIVLQDLSILIVKFCIVDSLPRWLWAYIIFTSDAIDIIIFSLVW